MAAERFTQIANGLFRDARLSFQAKGLFGYISTHATGWRVTVADLVRAGPDGRDAVRAGLSELQRHGYLIRDAIMSLLVTGHLARTGLPYVSGCTHGFSVLTLFLVGAALAAALAPARHAAHTPDRATDSPDPQPDAVTRA
ncbi:hypothetical protein [Streptomyces sp. NPDC001307]|uniref:hypothetical protein n=1 Tax=Streptomyces sp. NPDC001307 TaxID=3364560 RepID=UPI003686CE56